MDTYFDCNGRPLQCLTGEIWNEVFAKEKAAYSHNKNNFESFYDVYEQALCMTNPIINKYGMIARDFDEYADYLYSVFETFLDKKSDYCYYLYNIHLLLSIFGDALESRYLSEYMCFEVWLNESKLN